MTDVRRRLLSVVVIIVTFAGACSDTNGADASVATTTAAPASTTSTTTSTTTLPPEFDPDWPLALQLSENNTGIVGGVAEGECVGSSDDPYGELLVFEGDLTIDDDFARELGEERVFEGFDITGSLIVESDGVTVRCGRVANGGLYAIQNRAESVRYEWIEASQGGNGKVVLGGNYEIHRCDVSGGEDGLHINTGTVVVTECYIHDQNFIDDAHADAIQATSSGGVDSVTVERSKLINFFEAPNAAFQINVADEWSVTDSYLWGGAYSVLGDPGAVGLVTDNYFGWGSSQFGAVGGVNSRQTGNVWWEWVSPRCTGEYSSDACETPNDHPGNGTPVGDIDS